MFALRDLSLLDVIGDAAYVTAFVPRQQSHTCYSRNYKPYSLMSEYLAAKFRRCTSHINRSNGP